MVKQHRDTTSARELLIAQSNHGLGADYIDPAGSPSTSGGAAAGAAAGGAGNGAGAMFGGPVQMSSRQAVMLGEIERLIRSTQDSGGTQVGGLCVLLLRLTVDLIRVHSATLLTVAAGGVLEHWHWGHV